MVRTVAVLVFVFLFASAASAQQTSSIAGLARDESGAVLPGVTVEAASPALIERVRVAITDTDGRYTIIDLRPGSYAMTFTLPGFRTYRRDGIVLTAGFAATVDGELQVGALEETITVTGEAPLVDTQSARRQTVVSDELLDVLPTSTKNWSTLATLTPGMSSQRMPDVAGQLDQTVGRSFHALIAQVTDLRRAADLLEWDERVYMPPGGADAHGEMAATLRRLAHEAFTRDEVGGALEAARAEAGADRDTDAYRIVAVTAHDYAKATRVPADFVAEHAQATSAAQNAWLAARAASDFAAFRPHLEKIVDLKQRYVGFFRSEADATGQPYDVLLDDYEPGMKTADVRRVFDALRPRQVALIRAIGERPQVDDSCLQAAYAEKAVWDFAVEVITAFGFDWNRGRQDKSAHPFATGLGRDDVRITTRWVEGQPLGLLFGTMHETGHALYEQGVSAAWHRTMLEGGASLGVHESQSRLWENLVGRSRPFWDHFYPALQARFPAPLGGVTVDRFYRAVNKVEPSLVRVEADEATYNLHVMLRVELELGLIDGTLRVRDLPEIWRAKMQEYLGLTPPDDARGVLQDIHWAAGLFGYFATYTLGNLIATQLWDTFERVHPARDEDIRRGDFSALLAWLRGHLHQYGRKYQPLELVEKVTGVAIEPEPYLRYLERKYGEIYGIGPG